MFAGERSHDRPVSDNAVRSASALHAAPRHQPAHQSTDETSAPQPSTGCKTNSTPDVTRILRNMTSARQVKAVELMVSSNININTITVAHG